MKSVRKLLSTALITLLFVGILLTGFSTSQVYAAGQADLNLQVKAAILIEASTGQVLYEMNADTPSPPASMTKMMTEYLVLDAIAEGKISWDDVVTASPYVYFLGKTGGSRVYLGEGEKRTVRELFGAMAIYSANDATVMLAEHVAGSETNFVNMMNEKAKEFGMKNTHFVTCSGYPEELLGDFRPQIEGQHYMTAADTAILGKHLITDHPEVTEFTSKAKDTFRPGTKNELSMLNWNMMVPGRKYSYEGVDGLKTGSTDAAGYCVTETASRNGMRLISVIMGAENDDKRFQESIKLLDYGFNNFEIVQLASAGAKIPGYETVKVNKGKEKEVGIVTDKAYKTVIKKGEQELYEAKVTTDSTTLKAPLKKGEAVGALHFEYKGDQTYRYITPEDEANNQVSMVTEQEMEKASWIKLLFRAIFTFIANIFTAISKTVVGWFS